MKRLLSTKILPESLQARLEASGWELTQYNAISIELQPVVFRPQGRVVVFTSQHAVRACLSSSPGGDLAGSSCLCVGAKTASLIREHGGKVLEFAASASELAASISETGGSTLSLRYWKACPDHGRKSPPTTPRQ